MGKPGFSLENDLFRNVFFESPLDGQSLNFPKNKTSRQSSPAVVAQASTTINRSAEEDVSLIDNSTTHDKILVDDESVLPDHHYCHIEDIDEAASDGVTEKDTTCLQQWDQRPSLEDRLAVDQLEDTLNASGSGENVWKQVTPRRPNTILRNFDPLLNEGRTLLVSFRKRENVDSFSPVAPERFIFV